jgi:hypothetical protein
MTRGVRSAAERVTDMSKSQCSHLLLVFRGESMRCVLVCTVCAARRLLTTLQPTRPDAYGFLCAVGAAAHTTTRPHGHGARDSGVRGGERASWQKCMYRNHGQRRAHDASGSDQRWLGTQHAQPNCGRFRAPQEEGPQHRTRGRPPQQRQGDHIRARPSCHIKRHLPSRSTMRMPSQLGSL